MVRRVKRDAGMKKNTLVRVSIAVALLVGLAMSTSGCDISSILGLLGG
jgi:hypothetical protein